MTLEKRLEGLLVGRSNGLGCVALAPVTLPLLIMDEYFVRRNKRDDLSRCDLLKETTKEVIKSYSCYTAAMFYWPFASEDELKRTNLRRLK